MASSTLFQFDARNHAVVNLLGLGTTLVLPFAGVSRLKLQKQRAKIVLPNCACHLAQISLGLYSKGGGLRIICNFGTASYHLQSSKLVLNGDGALQRSEFAKL